MRVWLKTLEQMGTRRWSEPEPFERIEHALLRWLTIPIKKRVGGLIHEARESRKPTDDEVRLRDGRVNMGILIVSRDLALAYPRCIRVEEQDRNLDSDFPRVRRILLPWRVYEERDVITRFEESDALRRLASQRISAAPSAGATDRLRAEVISDGATARAQTPVEDVVDADWTEIAADAPGPGEGRRAGADASPEASAPSPSPAPSEPPAGLDVLRYRTALVVCRGLSPASGPAYRAACDEATERLEDFLGLPQPAAARKAARTAHGLLNALPRHFPSAEDAGRWAMEARPALGAFAEAAFAWAAHPPVAALAPAAPQADPGPVVDDVPVEAPVHDAVTPVSDEPEAVLAGAVDAADAGPSPEPHPAPAEAPPVDAAPPVAEVPKPTLRRRRRPIEAKAFPAPEQTAPSEPQAAVAKPDRATDAPAPARRGKAKVRDAAPPEAVAPPEPSVPAPGPAEPAAPVPAPVTEAAAGFPRRLTAGERKVMSVMSVRVSMRKHEIANAAGIGRGSANRLVDRLVSIGVCREAQTLRYVLSTGRA